MDRPGSFPRTGARAPRAGARAPRSRPHSSLAHLSVLSLCLFFPFPVVCIFSLTNLLSGSNNPSGEKPYKERAALFPSLFRKSKQVCLSTMGRHSEPQPCRHRVSLLVREHALVWRLMRHIVTNLAPVCCLPFEGSNPDPHVKLREAQPAVVVYTCPQSSSCSPL